MMVTSCLHPLMFLYLSIILFEDAFSQENILKRIEMITCKFSNEACQAKEECCSSNCLQAHPGTNPRCMRSTLNDSCLYNYQCEDSLVCGPFNRCCSKYWGICSRHDDCCHATFRCLEAEGFYYKRCLMQETNRANIPVQGLFAKNIWDLLLLMSLVFLFLC